MMPKSIASKFVNQDLIMIEDDSRNNNDTKTDDNVVLFASSAEGMAVLPPSLGASWQRRSIKTSTKEEVVNKKQQL